MIAGAHHRVRFSASGLPVRKASHLTTLEGSGNKGLHCDIVEALVVYRVVEDLIEGELVLFDVFREVYLLWR